MADVVSALHFTEQLTQWTANNIVDTTTGGGFDIYTFHETELAYPGHMGHGLWFVQGDMRVTDLTDFGYAAVSLWDETSELTYGLAGGAVADTNWHEFNIIAPWSGGLPTSMFLHLELATNGASNVVNFRNIRMKFVQIVDRGGIYSNGSHVQSIIWGYQPYANTFVPGGSQIGVSSPYTATKAGSYSTLFHMNGLEVATSNGGIKTNESANTMWAGLGLGFYHTANATITTTDAFYYRPEKGVFRSVNMLMANTGVANNGIIFPAMVVYNSANSAANASVEFAGGNWLMLGFNTQNFNSGSGGSVANSTLSGSNKSDNAMVTWLTFASSLGNTAADARCLSLGTAASKVMSNTAISNIITSDDIQLSEGYQTFKGGDGENNQYSVLAFSTEVMDSNPTYLGAPLYWQLLRTIRHKITANGGNSTTISTDQHNSVFAFLERNYVNSCRTLGQSAASIGGGGDPWSNVESATSADTDTYAYHQLSTSGASNPYLRVTDFGFDEFIPAGSTIGYIYMDVTYRKETPYLATPANVVWDDVKMVVGGSPVGSSVAWAGNWANTWTTAGPAYNLGTSKFWTLDNTAAEGGTTTRNGLWNYKPTRDQVAASNFGFQLRPRTVSGDYQDGHIAYVTATVYYRAPGESFIKSITMSANSVAVVDREKAISKSVSIASAGQVATSKLVSAVGIVTSAGSSLGAFIKNVVKPSYTTQPSVVSPIKRAVAKQSAIVSSTVTKTPKRILQKASSFTVATALNTFSKAVRKARAAFTQGTYYVIHKAINHNVAALTTGGTVGIAKRATKPSTVGVGSAVALYKMAAKRSAAISTSTPRIAKNVGRRFAITTTGTVNIIRATYKSYVQNIEVVAGSVVGFSKKVVVSRAVIGSTVVQVLMSGRLVLVQLALTAGSITRVSKTTAKTYAKSAGNTLGLRKTAGKALRVVEAPAIAVRKAISHGTRVVAGSTARMPKALARSLQTLAVGSTIRVRKMFKPIFAKTTASVVGTKKRVGHSFRIVSSAPVTVRKAISRSISKVAVSVISVRKLTRFGVGAIAGSTVRMAKSIGRGIAIAAVPVTHVRKLTRFGFSAATATVIGATTFKSGFIKIINLLIRELNFLVRSDNTMMMSSSERTGRLEYVSWRIMTLPDVDRRTVTVHTTEERTVDVTTIEERDLIL